jgi:hypothetical protein
VWRFKDSDNYYIVRANALEDNVVLYKTVGGKRFSLQVKGGCSETAWIQLCPAASGALCASSSGQLFTVFFNGSKLFEVEDNTFTEAGNVGVWTKADSVTLFDDFSYGEK